MRRIIRTIAIAGILLFAFQCQSKACVCIGPCNFLGNVDTMFIADRYAGLDPSERFVIVKAVIIDTIPNTPDGTRLKLLTQFFGRPVKDTFNHFGQGSDCDLSLRGFHYSHQDTLFLMLHRTVYAIPHFGDTVEYSMSMCGKQYAVIKNDSIVENCPHRLLPTASIADSLNEIVGSLKVTHDLSPLSGVTIYPNPATDKLIIEGLQGGKAGIISIIGRQVLSTSITTSRQTLNPAAIPAGTYMLVLTKADGSTGAVRITKE
jgi:hypothetical protein